MKRSIYTIIAASALFSTAANAFVLDFEGFPAGTIMDIEYAGVGVVIGAVNLAAGPDLAVVFDSNNPTGGDSDLGAPFGNAVLGPLSPGNLLILQENNNCDAVICAVPDDEGARPSGKFIIDFSAGVFLQSIDFFDVEGVEAAPNYAIELYDGLGNLIPGGFSVPDTGGDNMWAQVMFNTGGVHQMVINMGGSGAIDNITFETTVVPIPPALPLFLTALASMGLARRRR